MQPRYQVFLSSTFRDLRDERQSALEAILELGHFPAGMEAFPAADATPWDLIRSIIEDSDYYVLIVGGKYGSTGPDGISYTEMEFNLAVELGKPILAFLHGSPDDIPAGKSELEPEVRHQLTEFRKRVSERICKSWTNRENLKAAVLSSLVHAIRVKPAFGWVRNEGLENQELLKRLASLQERYDTLLTEVESLRLATTEAANASRFRGLEAPLEMQFTFGRDQDEHSVAPPLSDIFFSIADNMLVPSNETALRSALRTAAIDALDADLADLLTQNASDKDDYLRRNINVRIATLDDVLRQLLALGLVEPQMVLIQSGDQNGTETFGQRRWVLTRAGRARYLEKRAYLAQ